jgi:hypothetical protein
LRSWPDQPIDDHGFGVLYIRPTAASIDAAGHFDNSAKKLLRWLAGRAFGLGN